MRRFPLFFLFVIVSPPVIAQGVTCWGIQGYVSDPKLVFTFPSDDPSDVTVIGETQTVGVRFEGLEFHPDGNLYAYGRHSEPAQTGLYLVDQTTGVVTYIGGGETGGEWVRGLAYDPSTDQLVAVTWGGDSSSVYEIDVTTGAPTLLETTSDLGAGDGIAIDPAGERFLLDAAVTRIFRGCPPSGYAPLGPTGLNLFFESGIANDWSRDSLMYLVSWQFTGSHLYLVDPSDGTTSDLGRIGTSSGQQYFPTDVAFPLAAGTGPAIPEPDCNDDGVPDHCEIADDAVADDDSNGVPDPCDIATGASDCDANGVLDVADRMERSSYVPESGIRMAVGDVDSNGSPDIVLSNWFDNEIVLLINDGTGHFTAGSIFDHPIPQRIAVEDIDGDGANDLLIAGSTGMALRLGDGLGGFSPPEVVAPHSGEFHVADLNTDGLLDLVVVDASLDLVFVDLATSPGVFASTSIPLIDSILSDSHLDDFDGDGDRDLLVIYANLGLYRYDGDGTGGLLPAAELEAPLRDRSGLMDIDGDGTLDLVERRGYPFQEFRVYLGDGSGDFTLAWTEPAGSDPWTARAWDSGGNGLTSVVFAEEDSRFLTVHRWDTGALVPYQVFPLHRNVGRINFDPADQDIISIDDFDSDGQDDLAILVLPEGSVSVLLQREPDCDRNGTIDPCDFAAGGDGDGDGILDACEAVHFLRGDINADAIVDIGDPIDLLGRLFSGAGPAPCPAAADTNSDAAIDIGDVIYLLGFLFSGGASPLPPFPACGPSFDPGDAALGCGEPGC